jgi:drug/metabolite transporter (DMT)-like permease
MSNARAPGEHSASRAGPWLVALGAGLWGTESAWRIPLVDRLEADVIVLWEHVILVLLALPWILPRLGELRRVRARTIAWLVFSGVAGSAVGTIFFTLAVEPPNNATVVNVVLNLQPVVSTLGAVVIFRDRLARAFWPWAAVAVGSGVVLALQPGFVLSLDAGIGYALLCALCWGMSTVAGRGVMVEMSLPLATGLRFVVGLACMVIIVAARGHLDFGAPYFFSGDGGKWTATMLFLLATISGGIPTAIYFAGLARTRASIAGYFEMMQTLSGAAVTWVFFHHALEPYQVAAGVVLLGAVAMVQRAQQRIGV